MRQVFISHSTADRAAAESICRVLEGQGVACWIAPRDIAPGQEWADAIMLAIAEVRMLLLVHSEAVAASPMVRREVNAALSRRLPVMPVRIDGAMPRDGMEFYLGASHWLDAHEGTLEAHLPRIAGAVAGLLAEAVPMLPAEAAFVDRPAIAVLPFRGYGAEDQLAEGLTDDLIAAVSAWRLFPVISRNSVFGQGGGTGDVRMLGRLLGARYIVSGGVRRAGGVVRVTAELVDVASGAVLIAESFERAADETLRLQGEIVRAIGGVLAPEVWRQERERAVRRPAANATAHDLVRRGMWHRHRGTREDLVAAEAFFTRALEVEPEYAAALAALSISRNFAAIRRWTEDVPGAFREALDYARRAVEADPGAAPTRFALGIARMNLGEREAALAELREAVRLDPSYAAARANLGQVFNYLDRPEEALPELEVALRLSPYDPYRYQWMPYVAASHYLAGRYRECLVASQQALESNPEYPLALRYLVAALGQLGRAADAAPILALVRRVDRDLATLEAMARRLFVRGAADRIVEGLRRAGFA